MNKYKSLYKWMLIPMAVMQLGIFRDYWGDFSDNAWSVHIHYWTGSVWYVYLIIQPYFAIHGQIARHRTNGIIGMFLAGGLFNSIEYDEQGHSDSPESVGNARQVWAI